METFINILKKICIIVLGIAIWYGFISLCAWSLNPGEWSGFARFILGFVSVFVIIFGAEENF